MDDNEALQFAEERLSRIGYQLEMQNHLPCRSFYEKQWEMLIVAVRAMRENAKLRAELQEYKQAEEAGLLVRLPCKVGDTVWLTRWWEGAQVKQQNPPISRVVEYFSILSDYIQVHVKDGVFRVRDFGNIVFLTPEAAKAELEGKV